MFEKAGEEQKDRRLFCLIVSSLVNHEQTIVNLVHDRAYQVYTWGMSHTQFMYGNINQFHSPDIALNNFIP